MKKKSLIAPVYLILLFVFIFLTSCTNNNGLSQTNSSPTSENPSSQTSSNPIVEETFLITFDANGGEFEDGSAKKVVEIDSGQLLTLPTTALEHRSFYTFVGWSYLSDPNELWDFSNDVVQREMTLYAMWQSQWFDYEIIDNEATIIDSNLDASTTTIEIPSAIRDVDGKDYSVTTIGDSAFNNCINLTSIAIPNSVTTIGNSAFSGCSNLTSIVIPNSVTTIGGYAFSKCRNLINIVIPDSITTIGGYAFFYCSNLEIIYCEATSQPSGWDSNWNLYANSFEEFPFLSIPVVWEYIDSSTATEYEYAVCEDEEGNKYITLVRYIGSSTDVFIPEFIEYNGKNIPVTTIGDNAFYGCSNLTSIVIPDSITTIGGYAFSDCSNLTSIVIPDSVTTIGGYAFSDCSNLTSIVIPDSITTIGGYAFSDCNNLETIYCEATSQPSGWDSNWNLCGWSSQCPFLSIPVVWGYNSEN